VSGGFGAAPVVLVTAVGRAEGARPAAAALACGDADADRATLLVDVGGRPPRPTLLASVAARRLEERLVAHLPGSRIAARGQLCQLAVGAEDGGVEAGSSALTVARGALAVVHAPPQHFRAIVDGPLGSRLSGVLLRADLAAERALTSLVVAELRERGLAVAVLKQRLPWVAERRALFGALGADAAGGLPPRLVRRLVPAGLSRDTGDRATVPAGARAS
jgi:hypothetical protein